MPNRSVLNVGGNSKLIPLPSLYDGWEQKMLDIDPKSGADYIADARDMFGIKEKFFSVYCSHTLEHFYAHDIPKVLEGFKHVLDKDGFLYLRVPDIKELIKKIYEEKLDLDDTLYMSAVGKITGLDVLYGLQKEIKESGSDWFAHKTGYTPKLLRQFLTDVGFKNIFIKQEHLEIVCIASNKLTENPFEL